MTGVARRSSLAASIAAVVAAVIAVVAVLVLAIVGIGRGPTDLAPRSAAVATSSWSTSTSTASTPTPTAQVPSSTAPATTITTPTTAAPVPTSTPPLPTTAPATTAPATTAPRTTQPPVTARPPTEPPATTRAPATTQPSIDEPGSLWWIVNRDRPLPAGYVPADLVTTTVPAKPGAGPVRLSAPTAAAFEAMAAAAADDGFELQANSGYRSFDEQQQLMDRYVRAYGAATAATLVAVPGTSEHQTGLAVDVGLVGLPDDQPFGSTAASRWVADNAHRFGFIVRYPPDKSAITGYANEPWHLREVGVDLATELHDSGQTMEERFAIAAVTS